MMKRVALRAHPSASPLLRDPGTPSAEALVVVGADKGLCGSYNSNLFRSSVAHLRALQPESVSPRLFLFGRRAHLFFGKIRDLEISRAYPDPVEKIEYRTVRRVMAELVTGYLEGRWQRVRVIYTSMKSLVSFKPVVQQLLPVTGGAGMPGGNGPGPDYIMEPAPDRILERLLPRYLEMQLYAAILDSLASEFASRRMAMKSATDNAEEMTNSLTMEYNKARQTGITSELLEIIGGAEALKAS
jgi:F-type H+-transporting ATPase subunit gamma